MTYDAALEYIFSSYGAGKKKGLSCLKDMLAILDNPHEKLKIIHVAGTNGKGSTCAMLASVLQETGASVGLFTSPHLHKYNERFQINGQCISDADFSRYICVIKEASHTLFGNEENMFSFFEILTAVAFLYFYEKKVDFLILETGLGGKLDSTNIIENPLLCIITSIGLDHMEILGNTIESIAYEKCGIIKKNCPVVLYFQCDTVYNICVDICKDKNAKMYYDNSCKVSILSNDFFGVSFNVFSKYYKCDNVKIPLIGDYQVSNVQTVFLAICALNDLGIDITKEQILKGLEKTKWPGRMEVIFKFGKVFILDGAHNIDGVNMLGKWIEKNCHDKEITILSGILKDKEYDKMINILCENGQKIILTKPLYEQRAAEPSDLFEAIVNKNKYIAVEENYKKALDLAIEKTSNEGLIICSGSLYLIGDIRQYLISKEEVY